jgi:hypothetical protein
MVLAIFALTKCKDKCQKLKKTVHPNKDTRALPS